MHLLRQHSMQRCATHTPRQHVQLCTTAPTCVCSSKAYLSVPDPTVRAHQLAQHALRLAQGIRYKHRRAHKASGPPMLAAVEAPIQQTVPKVPLKWYVQSNMCDTPAAHLCLQKEVIQQQWMLLSGRQ